MARRPRPSPVPSGRSTFGAPAQPPEVGTRLGPACSEVCSAKRFRNGRGRPRVLVAMTTSFAVTYDYRCPFARNAHEHLVTALRSGADWDVDFVPFSLSQIHDEEGDVPVWEDPDRASDLLA